MKDSYDKHDLLFKSLEEIKKDPATTLDEKVLARFGIDAIQSIWDRQDNIKANCAIEHMV